MEKKNVCLPNETCCFKNWEKFGAGCISDYQLLKLLNLIRICSFLRKKIQDFLNLGERREFALDCII